MSTAPSRPRRRWLRYSLRTLFVAVSILCIWLGLKVNAARRQREAVAALTRSGADVSFDYQTANNATSDATPPGPAWLRKLIGDDYFTTVTLVIFERRTIHREDLMQLGRLLGLKALVLIDTKFVDDGSGIERPLQASDLMFIEHLSELRTVHITNARIGVSVIKALTGKGNLTSLSLQLCPVDDLMLQQIGLLTSLKELGLAETGISDSGLSHLKGLVDLRFLDLSRNQVSDAGVRQLNALKSLTHIKLNETQVTPLGIDELHKSRPDTKVIGP